MEASRRTFRRTSTAVMAGSGLLLLCTSSVAQNVTLYGNVDGGIAVLRSGLPGVATRAVTSGVSNSNRWGIVGSEDLGGGLKATFQLEAGFELDTGAFKSVSSNPSTATPTSPNGVASVGFGRKALVGISSNYGAITLGRDYSPVYYAALEGDIFRLGLFGNIQAFVTPAGGSERLARVSNALFYRSPEIGGLKIRAAYSLGSEAPGSPGGLPKEANRFFGIGAEYKISNLTLIASLQELKYPVVSGTPLAFTGITDKRHDMLVAARYNIGNFGIAAGHWKASSPQNVSDTWLGASYRIGSGTLLAQIQQLRQDNPTGPERKGHSIGIGYRYNLSKRTDVYATYGRTDNNRTGNFSLSSNEVSVAAGAPGADPSAIGIGVRHSF